MVIQWRLVLLVVEARFGYTPLHKAVKGGFINIVQFLLERADIDPNKTDKDGSTPFDVATEEERFKIVKLLLERTTIDLTKVYKDGNTVLHNATRSGELELVQLLLKTSNIDPNQKNKSGNCKQIEQAMVYCVAFNCNTRSGQGYGLFTFPKESDRRKIWIEKVMRQNFLPMEHSRLCSKHFNFDQFVIDARIAASVKFTPKQKTLKPNAVPTILDYKSGEKTSALGTGQSKRKRHASRALEKRRRLEVSILSNKIYYIIILLRVSCVYNLVGVT
ncbi:unnamed protein product [Mytilus edulis]|uniref:THAP-type domain-containing protein n=1 Tax=Mytilus edulis TaxID=6550 RepID=A0A8S3RY33_MYTED|nr:unnamed protein product [Mytilus edulis]